MELEGTVLNGAIVVDTPQPLPEGTKVKVIVPTAACSSPRPFGLAAGAFVVPDDFDAALPDDILREFEGR